MDIKSRDFFGFSFKLAAFINVFSLFFPWWSKFEIIGRIHSDAFFFGFVSYYVDPPPVIVILPSANASLEVTLWSGLFFPLVVLWLILICLGSYFYFKASPKAKTLTKHSLLGVLFSSVALLGFIFSVIEFGGFGSFVGTSNVPSWQDWGPDIGFFLFSFSVTLSFVALIEQLNNGRLNKKISTAIDF